MKRSRDEMNSSLDTILIVPIEPHRTADNNNVSRHFTAIVQETLKFLTSPSHSNFTIELALDTKNDERHQQLNALFDTPPPELTALTATLNQLLKTQRFKILHIDDVTIYPLLPTSLASMASTPAVSFFKPGGTKLNRNVHRLYADALGGGTSFAQAFSNKTQERHKKSKKNNSYVVQVPSNVVLQRESNGSNILQIMHTLPATDPQVAYRNMYETIQPSYISPQVYKTVSGGTSGCAAHIPTKDLLGVTVVMISDTHGMHSQLDIPRGDILIHAGDFTIDGKMEDANNFNCWLGELSHRFQHTIVVNGNHELKNMALQHALIEKNLLTNAIFLKDQARQLTVELTTNGVGDGDGSSKSKSSSSSSSSNTTKTNVSFNIYGTDYYSRCSSGAEEGYKKIPNNTNVLIVHNPPMNTCDSGGSSNGDNSRRSPLGCVHLKNRIDQLSSECGHLKLVVCGHLHRSHGLWNDGEVTVCNAAMVEGDGHERLGWKVEVLKI